MRIHFKGRRTKAALGAAGLVLAILTAAGEVADATGVAGAYQAVLQEAHAAEGQRWGGRDRRGARMGSVRDGRAAALLPLLRQLELSDEQRQQVRAAIDASRVATRESSRAARAARRALAAAVTGAAADEDRIRTLAAELGAIEGEVAVERARLYAAVWQLLTPEQQARATEMRTEREERREERRGRLRERLEERLQDLGER